MLTKERAEEVWAVRGMQNEVKVTKEEDAYVRRVWATLPGTSSWMSAFYLILNGNDPLR